MIIDWFQLLLVLAFKTLSELQPKFQHPVKISDASSKFFRIFLKPFTVFVPALSSISHHSNTFFLCLCSFCFKHPHSLQCSSYQSSWMYSLTPTPKKQPKTLKHHLLTCSFNRPHRTEPRPRTSGCRWSRALVVGGAREGVDWDFGGAMGNGSSLCFLFNLSPLRPPHLFWEEQAEIWSNAECHIWVSMCVWEQVRDTKLR